MTRRPPASAALAAAIMLPGVLASCAPSAPPGIDLAPVLMMANTETDRYEAACHLNYETLRVFVTNNGRDTAPPSTVRVTFWVPGGISAVYLDSPETRPQTVNVFELKIPDACFTPYCSFSILADANGDIAEYDEMNNLGYGLCKQKSRKPWE